MLKLHEMINEVIEVMNHLEENDVSEEVLTNTLDSLVEGSDLEIKVEALLKMVRNFELQAIALKNEEDRIKKLRQRYENNAKGIKEYVFMNLDRADIKKMNAGLFNLTKRKAPMSIEVVDESKIPESCVEMTAKVSKTALKEYVVNLHGKLSEGEHIFEDLGIKVINNKKTWSVK